LITQQQAFGIAQNIVPDIELKGIRISDQLSGNKKFINLPKNCWYLSYSAVPIYNLSCSTGDLIFICISKEKGEILFHNKV
jgi:hypothetical protein